MLATIAVALPASFAGAAQMPSHVWRRGVHAVTRRKRLILAAGALVALLGLGGVMLPAQTSAQGSCRATCWEGYGACYKSTSNRQRCQAQLQRCLDGCIRSRR